MPERSALPDVASQARAVFVEDTGWLMPAHYGDAAAEYQNAREHAALFDISHHGKVEVTGADGQTFLNNLCTNEVNKLPAGAGCEAFLTTGQAKIVAFVILDHVLLPDGRHAFLLDAGPGIPVDDRPRIFDRFWRGRGVRTEGAGLGLAIVMEIVRSHGASIAVADRAPGGARFDLRFRPA